MNFGSPFRLTAIGTGWQIDTADPLHDETRQRIHALTEDFDRVWSRFRADSLVTQVAQAAGGGRFEYPARDIPVAGPDVLDRLQDRFGDSGDGRRLAHREAGADP